MIFDAKYDLAINHLKKFETTLPTREFCHAGMDKSPGRVKAITIKAVYDSADLFLKNAEKLYSKQDTPHLAEIYNLLGTVYSYKGDFVKAQNSDTKSLNLFENLGDSTNVNLVTLELGDNYYDQEDFKKPSRSIQEHWIISPGFLIRCICQAVMLISASAYQQSKDIPNALIHAEGSCSYWT